MTTKEQNTQTPEVPEVPAAPEVPAPPAASSAPDAPPPIKKAKKRKRRRALRRIITFILVLAVIAAIAYAVWHFVFREEEVESDILTATASISSIQSTVQGSGNARAGANSAITLSANGTIEDVFVSLGDMVYEGQPLYTAFSPEAEENVARAEKACTDQLAVIEQRKKDVTTAEKYLDEAEKNLSKVQQELYKLRSKEEDLTLTAPFSGKLVDVETLYPGQVLSAGQQIATLVNDRRMSLTLYFSYAYENNIYVGKSVDVSVPALMLLTAGQVEEIHKVNFISPEGGVFFEVVIGLDNPGTLTAGMAASAVMRTAAGVDVYPYDNGELEYSGMTAITVKQSGPVTTVGSMRNYTNVEAGQTLLTQSRELLDQEIESFMNTVDAASDMVSAASEGIIAAQQAVLDAEAHLTELEEALETAREGLGNFDAVAPISGTITSCTIVPGQEVPANTTVITISDTTNMTVEITVDDRNIPFVTPGMTVELSDWNGFTYFGTVTNIDMSNSEFGSMGMTTYPVTLSVENYSGSLYQGMWLNYSFVTSQSDDCIVVPIQCVKSIVDTEGNPYTVVFIQSDSKPDNAIDFEPPETYPGQTPTYPSSSDGYWPIPVETGLSDRYNVEITSGLNAGDTLFSTFMMTGAWSY